MRDHSLPGKQVTSVIVAVFSHGSACEPLLLEDHSRIFQVRGPVERCIGL